MPISHSTLLALQKAGENVHTAQRAFANEVQSNAARVVRAVASEPFSNEADRAYAQLRRVARMAHELQAIEEQLKTLYGAASEMEQPETQVIAALPDHGGRSYAPSSTRSLGAAEDAVVKSAWLKAKPQRKAPKVKPAPRSLKTVNSVQEAASLPQGLSANDQKVLAFLKTVLDRRSWVGLTQVAMSHGAGIPQGSIGTAIRRLLAAGAVREKEKGTYRLA